MDKKKLIGIAGLAAVATAVYMNQKTDAEDYELVDMPVGPISITHVNGSALITTPDNTYQPVRPKNFSSGDTMAIEFVVKQQLPKPAPPIPDHPQQYILAVHVSYPSYYMNSYRGMKNTLNLNVGDKVTLNIDSLWGQAIEGMPEPGLYNATMWVDVWMATGGEYFATNSYGPFQLLNVIKVG